MTGTVIVTGASQGIGKATALAFAGAGWTVGLLARSGNALREIAAAAGPAAHVLECDVTDAQSVDAAFDQFVGRAGRLDCLFNNAGRAAPAATIDEIDPAVWRQVVDVNLTGMFLCARAAFARMRLQSPQGGRIVNNGSISAYAPRPGSAPYTATKHGVTGLTRTIALDGRPFGIACGQIDIGNAATDMTEAMAAGVMQADGSVRAEPRMPVEEVARAVLAMAQLPKGTNVLFQTIMATNMPFVGRG